MHQTHGRANHKLAILLRLPLFGDPYLKKGGVPPLAAPRPTAGGLSTTSPIPPGRTSGRIIRDANWFARSKNSWMPATSDCMAPSRQAVRPQSRGSILLPCGKNKSPAPTSWHRKVLLDQMDGPGKRNETHLNQCHLYISYQTNLKRRPRSPLNQCHRFLTKPTSKGDLWSGVSCVSLRA